jgi:UDP:flavonoid glycosyltransferase YjiC (YdhE family)
MFCAVDREAFVDDLARCRALVTTAGNQVVGEALHLGKPVLALPEPGNWEQGLNGFFLERMGVGACASMHTLRSKAIREFLSRLDAFRAAMPRGNAGGNAEVSRILEEFLATLPSRKRDAFSWRSLRAAFQQVAA